MGIKVRIRERKELAVFVMIVWGAALLMGAASYFGDLRVTGPWVDPRAFNGDLAEPRVTPARTARASRFGPTSRWAQISPYVASRRGSRGSDDSGRRFFRILSPSAVRSTLTGRRLGSLAGTGDGAYQSRSSMVGHRCSRNQLRDPVPSLEWYRRSSYRQPGHLYDLRQSCCVYRSANGRGLRRGHPQSTAERALLFRSALPPHRLRCNR